MIATSLLPSGRFIRFALVGLSGVAVDMALMQFLTSVLGWTVLPAKVAAGEAALLNNFLWNDVWTFSGSTGPRSSRWVRLARFHLVCMGGFFLGTTLAWILWHQARLPVPIANAFAISACAVWNFAGASRWGWRPQATFPVAPGEPMRPVRSIETRHHVPHPE